MAGDATPAQRVRLIAGSATVQSIFLMSTRNRIASERAPLPASIARRAEHHTARKIVLKDILNHLVATRTGTLAVLALAAFTEVYGDSFFQIGLHRATGVSRYLAFAGGAVMLALYGLIVNTPPWDFGKLLGLYVVVFFLMAQLVAWVRFQQTPTAPILVGGSLIVAGGAVMTLWKG